MGKPPLPDAVSPALAAAQDRLLQARVQFEQVRAGEKTAVSPPPKSHTDTGKTERRTLNNNNTLAHPPTVWQQNNVRRYVRHRRRLAGIETHTQAPASDTASPDWLAQLRYQANEASRFASGLSNQPADALPRPNRQTVKIYPTLATAMLKHELAAPGRIYWLLKFLDKEGRGWLSVADIRQQLTRKGAPLRVCGWRRLRQIFAQGEGMLWQRDRNGRLWLYGAAKIARELESGRLRGASIELPVKTLLGGIQAVRANFYATWHSGRKTDNPISRETLRHLTGVPERTQFNYDHVAGVICRRNIAIGAPHNKNNQEQGAWRYGRAAFHFYDSQGQQGEAKRDYIAWHLPNSYTGPHRRACKGRQKKINRQLVDLVDIGVQGNHHTAIERIFWPHGAAAAHNSLHSTSTDAYWLSGKSQIKQYDLWQVLPGKQE